MGGKEPAFLTRGANPPYLLVLLFYLVSCSFMSPPHPFLFSVLFSWHGGVGENGKRFVVGKLKYNQLLLLLEFLSPYWVHLSQRPGLWQLFNKPHRQHTRLKTEESENLIFHFNSGDNLWIPLFTILIQPLLFFPPPPPTPPSEFPSCLWCSQMVFCSRVGGFV